MNSLDVYKAKILEVERARSTLERLESELGLLEVQLRDGASPKPNSRHDVPERLKYLIGLFEEAGGRMSLNDAAKKVHISRTGVWNQIKMLIKLGHVRQVDRGLYELIP